MDLTNTSRATRIRDLCSFILIFSQPSAPRPRAHERGDLAAALALIRSGEVDVLSGFFDQLLNATPNRVPDSASGMRYVRLKVLLLGKYAMMYPDAQSIYPEGMGDIGVNHAGAGRGDTAGKRKDQAGEDVMDMGDGEQSAMGDRLTADGNDEQQVSSKRQKVDFHS